MILLALVLMSEIPPPPSGRALPDGEVEILDPIAPAVGTYHDCLNNDLEKSGALLSPDRDRYRRGWQSAMRACAEVRATSVAEADRALARAPDYQDAARRDLAIRHAFEGTDDWFRRRPEIMERVIREGLARQRQQRRE